MGLCIIYNCWKCKTKNRWRSFDAHFQEVVARSFTSLLGDGSDIVCIIFADNRSRYNHYVTISMNSPWIIHGGRLKIVDALMRLTLNILTLIVCSIAVWYESNNDYWHPMNRFYVWSFASRTFMASQFQNCHYTHFLSDGWRSQCAFLRFRVAIDGMLISTLILN